MSGAKPLASTVTDAARNQDDGSTRDCDDYPASPPYALVEHEAVRRPVNDARSLQSEQRPEQQSYDADNQQNNAHELCLPKWLAVGQSQR
jgi:hypothetical protein